jgi:hypothetical protein
MRMHARGQYRVLLSAKKAHGERVAEMRCLGRLRHRRATQQRLAHRDRHGRRVERHFLCERVHVHARVRACARRVGASTGRTLEVREEEMPTTRKKGNRHVRVHDAMQRTARVREPWRAAWPWAARPRGRRGRN